MRTIVTHFVAVGLALVGLPPGSAFAVRFVDVAAEAGVQVTHDCFGVYPGGSQEQNFYGSGLAWADLNYDGWLDLILANGEVGSSVFLNNGDGTFDEVVQMLSRPLPSASTGVALADVDNDGDLDVSMVNNYGEPYLYQGGPPMVEAGTRFGVNPLYDPTIPPPDNWIGPQSMGTAFGDIDEDGYLDLYVANYGVLQRDMIFNAVNGSRFDRTTWLNSVSWAHGFQPVFWDFDNDGDQDIYVANDFGRNYLFQNGGRLEGYALTEVAEQYKVAGGTGWPNPASLSMGIAVGDYDNDLDLDLYITNYVENALYQNDGPRGETGWRFTERAAELGIQYLKNSWGTEFADFDLDGDLDLILTAGWIHGEVVLDQGKNLDDRFYLNDGPPNYTFTDATESSDFGTDQLSGRGLAVADYDRDGDLDVGVWYNTLYENDTPPSGPLYEGRFALYQNDQTTENHWLILKLVGDGRPGAPGCSRSAVGARVEVTTGSGAVQIREVRAGGSYLSQSSLELEFGLGAETSISRVRVSWLCGGNKNFRGVTADGIFELHEGEDTARLAVTTPTRLAATWTGLGMELAWHHAAWLRPDGVVLERAVAAETPAFAVVPVGAALDERTGAILDDTAEEDVDYVYRVTLRTPRGDADPITVAATSGEYTRPTLVSLGQNFPNPTRPNDPTTTILYSVPSSMHVKVVIYDLRGRLVNTLVDEFQDANQYAVDWNGTDGVGNRVARGTYIYSLQTLEGSESRRLTLLR